MESCFVCGDSEAAHVKLRGVSSRIIWYNVQTLHGPVCADCAEGAYWYLQRRTLIQGWWGPISALLALWNSIANVVNIRQHRAAIPFVHNGREWFARPEFNVRSSALPWLTSFVALVVLAFVLAVVFNPSSSSTRGSQTSIVGSCWDLTSGDSLTEVTCGSGHEDYWVTKIVTSPTVCPADYMETSGAYACLSPR